MAEEKKAEAASTEVEAKPSRWRCWFCPSSWWKCFVTAIGWLTIPGAFLLTQQGLLRLQFTTNAEDIPTFSDRLFFTFEWFVLIAFWLTFNTVYVISKRHKADRSTDEKERAERNDQAETGNRILTNSLEQAVLSIIAQLAVIPHLSGDQTIKFIPLINLLWFVGRLFFFRGYPDNRCYGFSLSWVTSILAINYAFVLFIKNNFVPF